LTETALPKPKKVGSLHATILREELTGYLFVLPAFLIILTFGLFPIGYSIYMSLFNWGVVKGKFVADKNYLTIFGKWENLLIVVAGLVLEAEPDQVWSSVVRCPNTRAIVGNAAVIDLGICVGAI